MPKKVGYQGKQFSWKMESHIKEAIAYADSELTNWIYEATEGGYQEAKSRISGHRATETAHIADRIDWNVEPLEGRVYEHGTRGERSTFYARFVEYGTVKMAPIPFIRPAHRKMRAIFKAKTGGDLFRGFKTTKVKTSAKTRKGLLAAHREGRIGKRELNRRLAE